MSVLWHYVQNGATLGPVPEEKIHELVSSGALRGSDLVWREGLDSWSTIQAIPELITAVPQRNEPPLQPPSKGALTPLAPVKRMGIGGKVVIGCGGLLGLFLLTGVVASSSWGGRNYTPNLPPTADQKPNPEPSQSQGQPNEAFTNEVLRVYNLRSTTGKGHVDFTKIEDRSISITITYDTPQSLLAVKKDLKVMVMAVIAKLLVDGHRPSEESFSIYVWGHTPVSGLTGTSRVLSYGGAYYDYIDDNIKYSPPSN